MVFFACSEDVDSSIGDITSDVYENPNFAKAIVVPSNADNSLDLAELHDDILTIQDYAYSTYGTETVCGCDCDGSEAVQSSINEYNHLFDKYINNDSTNSYLDYECSEWLSIAAQDCNFETFSDFWDNTDSILTDMPNISLEEKDFIRKIVNDMINEEFSNELLREEWYNLSSDNYNGNIMSAIMLETSITMKDFIDSDNGPIGDDVSPLWWHVGNAIRGAAVAYVVAAGYEVVAGDDPPSFTNEDCKEAVIKGGIGGALMAF